MNIELIKSSIEKIQNELNNMTEMSNDLLDHRILQLSMKLDKLIVEYQRLVS